MNYLRVRNWQSLQHYKSQHGAPRWIKLYHSLLSDYDFNSLSELNRGRLMRLWLLAALTENQIPDDPRWVARQIGASSIDLDGFVSMGFLEAVYDDSREPLAPSEQKREEKIRAERTTTNANGYVYPERAIHKLLEKLTDKDAKTEHTIRSLSRRHRLAEGDLAWALECATGPGVLSPTKVAVAELRKRGEAKTAA